MDVDAAVAGQPGRGGEGGRVDEQYFKGRMLEAWEAGEDAAARCWFITGFAMFPKSPDLLYEQYRFQMGRRQYAAAFETLEVFLELPDEDNAVLKAIRDIFQDSNAAEEAKKLFSTANAQQLMVKGLEQAMHADDLESLRLGIEIMDRFPRLIASHGVPMARVLMAHIAKWPADCKAWLARTILPGILKAGSQQQQQDNRLCSLPDTSQKQQQQQQQNGTSAKQGSTMAGIPAAGLVQWLEASLKYLALHERWAEALGLVKACWTHFGWPPLPGFSSPSPEQAFALELKCAAFALEQAGGSADADAGAGAGTQTAVARSLMALCTLHTADYYAKTALGARVFEAGGRPELHTDTCSVLLCLAPPKAQPKAQPKAAAAEGRPRKRARVEAATSTPRQEELQFATSFNAKHIWSLQCALNAVTASLKACRARFGSEEEMATHLRDEWGVDAACLLAIRIDVSLNAAQYSDAAVLFKAAAAGADASRFTQRAEIQAISLEVALGEHARAEKQLLGLLARCDEKVIARSLRHTNRSRTPSRLFFDACSPITSTSWAFRLLFDIFEGALETAPNKDLALGRVIILLQATDWPTQRERFQSLTATLKNARRLLFPNLVDYVGNITILEDFMAMAQEDSVKLLITSDAKAATRSTRGAKKQNQGELRALLRRKVQDIVNQETAVTKALAAFVRHAQGS